MAELREPVERWLIVYWDIDLGKWVLDLPGQHDDETTARRFRDLYRQELGRYRVRMIHTADGS